MLKTIYVFAGIGVFTTFYLIFQLVKPVDEKEFERKDHFKQSVSLGMDLLREFCLNIKCEDDPKSESKKICYSGKVKVGEWIPNECYQDFMTRSYTYESAVRWEIPNEYRKYIEEGERKYRVMFSTDKEKTIKEIYKDVVYKCDSKEKNCIPETKKNSNPVCKDLPDTDNSCQPFYCNDDGELCRRENGINNGFPLCGKDLKESPMNHEQWVKEQTSLDIEARKNGAIRTCYGVKEYNN